MSESRNILTETARSLFLECAKTRDFEHGWRKIAEAGLPDLLVSESHGGFGGNWGDAFAVLRLAGFYSAALPVPEVMIAQMALACAKIAKPNGLTGLADLATGQFEDGLFTGTLSKVPWGRHLGSVLITCDKKMLLVDLKDAKVTQSSNIASEPRDTVDLFKTPAAQLDGVPPLRQLGALARVAQAAGALDAALVMSIGHANTRQQFGKTLAKQQAVQQALAVAACEAAVVNSAGQAAAAAMDDGDATLEIAAAKLRTNQAIGISCAIFHQVHGAIGFTEEYPLNQLTKRLMSWRSEYGGDKHWSSELGGMAARAGAVGFWDELTRRSDQSTATNS